MTYDEWKNTIRLLGSSIFIDEYNAIEYYNSVQTKRYDMACKMLLLEFTSNKNMLSLTYLLNHHQKDKLDSVSLNIDTDFIANIMDTTFTVNLDKLNLGIVDLFDITDDNGFTHEFYNQSLLSLSQLFLPMSPDKKRSFIFNSKNSLSTYTSVSGLCNVAGFIKFFKTALPDEVVFCKSPSKLDDEIKQWRQLKLDTIVNKTLLCKWILWCTDNEEGFNLFINLLKSIGANNLAVVLET